jgi:hypothetical protein
MAGIWGCPPDTIYTPFLARACPELAEGRGIATVLDVKVIELPTEGEVAARVNDV